MKPVNKIIHVLSFILLSNLLLINTASADIAIVVNKNSPLSSISSREAKRIFLGVTKRMPNGSDILIVDYGDSSKLKMDFYKKLTSKNLTQIRTRWAGLIFSGKGIPPKEVSGNEDAKQWLRSNLNGIGYIDEKYMDASIKKVLTIKN